MRNELKSVSKMPLLVTHCRLIKPSQWNQQFVSRVFTLLRSFDSTDFYGAMWWATAANNVFRTLFIAANSKKIRQAAAAASRSCDGQKKPLDKNYTEKSQVHEHRAAVITIFRVRNKIKKKLLIMWMHFSRSWRDGLHRPDAHLVLVRPPPFAALAATLCLCRSSASARMHYFHCAPP